MTEKFRPRDSQRFEAALRRFDEENARDPNIEHVAGVVHPGELIYAEWLTELVLKLCPDASEALRLAARSNTAQRSCMASLATDKASSALVQTAVGGA